jgi:hypothetical protein
MSDFDWLEHHFKQSRERDEKIMADITKLNEAVAGMGASVDAAVAEIAELKASGGGSATPTQAEVDSLTSAVEADAAKLMAAKTA